MNQFINHKLIHVEQNEIDEVVKRLPKGRTVGEFSAIEVDQSNSVGSVLGVITITHIASEISRAYNTGWDTNWGNDFNQDVKNGVF